MRQQLSVAAPNSLMGLALETTRMGVEGTLYFVDSRARALRRVVVGADGSCAAEQPANGCADGVRNGEETDVDCGGRVCARCALGASCGEPQDCESSNCTASSCGAAEVHMHTATLFHEYLESGHYLNSFLHHMVHQDMDDATASYLNP